jgi:hypothetical protein
MFQLPLANVLLQHADTSFASTKGAMQKMALSFENGNLILLAPALLALLYLQSIILPLGVQQA